MQVSLEQYRLGSLLRSLLADTRVWLSVIVVGFVAHTLVFGSYLIDDAVISLSYSRNLANGYGLVLTPESERVEGYSNFLWVVLFALPFKLGLGDLHPMWLYKPVGIAFGIGTLIVTYLLPRIAYNASQNDPLALFAPFALSVSTTFTHWMVAGLENPLYAFLLVFSAYLYLHELADPNRKPWSALTLLLLALTRPEGIIYAGVALIHRTLYLAWKRQLPTRRDLFWIGVLVAGYGSFLLWRYSYFGYWVPNTFYAKVGEKRSLLAAIFNFNDGGWRYIIEFASQQWLRFLAPLFLLGLLSRTGWWANVLFVGVLASTTLYIIYAGGDWMQEFRFISIALPFLYLLVGSGLWVLRTVLTSGPDGLLLVPTKGLVAMVGVGAILLVLLPNYYRTTQIVMRVKADGIMKRGAEMRLYAQQINLNIPKVKYLEPDVGGTSYVSGMTIIDLAMLADIHTARFKYFPSMFREYIFAEQQPEFVRTHGYWTRTTKLTTYPEFWQMYLPIKGWRDEYGISGNFVRKDLFVAKESDLQSALPFANGVELALRQFSPVTAVGYPGQIYQFTWYWQCKPSCTKDYQTRLVLRHQDTQTEVQYDFDPVFGWYPTSLWESGEVISETYHIALPATMLEGAYDILVGYLDGEALLSLLPIGQVTIARDAAIQRAAERFLEHTTLQAKGDWKAAHDALLEAIALDPTNAEYIAAKSVLLDNWQASLVTTVKTYIDAGEWATAVDAMTLLQQLGALEGEARSLRRTLRDQLFRLGEEAFAAHRYDAAATFFQRVLAIDPQYVWARHRLEDTREMRHYAEYYCATGQYERLWETYQQEVKAGNYPNKDQMAHLYRCLSHIADETTLNEWRSALDFPDNVGALFYEDGTPKIRLLDYKVVPRVSTFELHLFFESIEQVNKPYIGWLHGVPNDVSILPKERQQYGFENFGRLDMAPPVTQWIPGNIYMQVYTLYANPGEYDLRFGFWVPSPEARMSLDAKNTVAGIGLGRVQVGSPKFPIGDRTR